MRLKHEFRALRDLEHPNLVSFGELFESAGDWFFTMELVRGQDLLSWVRVATEPVAEDSTREVDPSSTATVAGSPNAIARDPRAGEAVQAPVAFDEGRLREGLRQLALGLEALHGASKIHRDIKPSNILVTPDSRLVILDFGLVSDLVYDDGDNEVAGTYVFMAPEQTTPNPVGPAADWYSVGVLLYIALTGRPPIVGMRDVLFELKRTLEPPSPSRLGVLVPPDLDALCVDLLRIDPAARPTAAEVQRRLGVEPALRREALSPPRDAPFVGREEQLRELRRAFRDSRTGRAVTVLVHGESGVGKSTLVRRFLERVGPKHGGAIVLSGRCYERESVPYKAIDEIVDGLSRHLRRLPEVEVATLLPRMASLLTNVFPVLLDVDVFAQAPRTQPEVADKHELRARVFAALRELLSRLGDRHAVVLAIDDLQWADADSLALLAEVLRPPMPPTVLLLVTVRTVSDPGTTQRNRLDEWLALLGDARHVWLQNLPHAEARQLVGLLSATPEGDRLNFDSIADESEGHPLFIDALVRHRLSHGQTATAPRLEEALWERVRQLAAPHRQLLEVVAVAGRPLPQAVVARAAALEPADFSPAVTHLRLANFVRTDGVRSTDAIEPYHDRVRAAVRGKLSQARLAECNERLAIALEVAGGGDPEALAVYWRGAGYLDRAARHAVSAAGRAANALAFERAAELYGLALELQAWSSTERRELLVHQGDALADAGQGARAGQVYLQAAELFDSESALELRRRAAEQLLMSGRIDAGTEVLGSVLRSVGLSFPHSDGAALASVVWHSARLKLRGFRYRERAAADVPAELLRRVDVCWTVAHGLAGVSPMHSTAFAARGARLALEAGERSRIAQFLMLHATLMSGVTPRGWQKMAVAAAVAAEQAGNEYVRILHHATYGVQQYFAGEMSEAVKECTAAEAELRERCRGVSWEILTMQSLANFSRTFLGDWRDTALLVQDQVRAAEQRGDLYGAATLGMALGWVRHLAANDPDAALRELDAYLARWSSTHMHYQHFYDVETRAYIFLYRREPGAALAYIDQRWPSLRAAGLMRVRVLQTLGLALRISSLIETSYEPGVDRSGLLTRARRDIRDMRRQPFRGADSWGLHMEGCLAAARGDRQGAIVKLRQSGERMTELGFRTGPLCGGLLLGELIGGDEGAALVTRAESYFAQQGFRDPRRFASVFAPGAGRPRGSTP